MDYKERLEPKDISEILFAAINKSAVNAENLNCGVIYDLNFIEERLSRIQSSFSRALNTTAVKANPFIKILERVKNRGFGAEAASLPELYIAEAAGFDPGKIVFDSPAKTREEIAYAIGKGIYINADSLTELERIDEIIRSSGAVNYKAGLRINPQTGAGKILSTSVSGYYSKFGVPLNEKRAEITAAFAKYEWLKGLHLHTGSQGFGLGKLTEGVKKVLELAESINQKTGSVELFDIGGGLPVSYLETDEKISVEGYAERLKKEASGLFTGKYKLITEFGRYIFNPAGFAWSKVEYLKRGRNFDTLIIHLGADMFIRESYNPNDWRHEVLVADKYGVLKTQGTKRKYRIAGPLCFAGDFPAKETELPEVSEGDIIVIRDSGSYTAAMWSKYNSRQFPEITGYDRNNGTFTTVRKKERPEETALFWT